MEDTPSIALFGFVGCAGALLMFISDLILYYPVAPPADRTSQVYFDRIGRVKCTKILILR